MKNEEIEAIKKRVNRALGVLQRCKEIDYRTFILLDPTESIRVQELLKDYLILLTQRRDENEKNNDSNSIDS